MQRVMRVREVADYLCIGVSTVWRWSKEGKLPKGRQLSPRVTVWIKQEIDDFLEQATGIKPMEGLKCRGAV